MFAGVVPVGQEPVGPVEQVPAVVVAEEQRTVVTPPSKIVMRSGARHAGERGSLHEPITPLDANWIRPCGGRCPYRWG